MQRAHVKRKQFRGSEIRPPTRGRGKIVRDTTNARIRIRAHTLHISDMVRELVHSIHSVHGRSTHFSHQGGCVSSPVLPTFPQSVLPSDLAHSVFPLLGQLVTRECRKSDVVVAVGSADPHTWVIR